MAEPNKPSDDDLIELGDWATSLDLFKSESAPSVDEQRGEIPELSDMFLSEHVAAKPAQRQSAVSPAEVREASFSDVRPLAPILHPSAVRAADLTAPAHASPAEIREASFSDIRPAAVPRAPIAPQLPPQPSHDDVKFDQAVANATNLRGAVSLANVQGGVALSDIQASGISFEWFEAVAIVQSLCLSILERDPIGPVSLDSSAVFIDSTGRVDATLSGPRAANSAVHRLGRILDDVLPESDFMFLRPRIVGKATSWPPQYGSIHELSQALAYYERPNRAQLVRDVYARWNNTPHRALPAIPEVVPMEVRPEFSDILAQPHSFNLVGPSGRMSGKMKMIAFAVVAFGVSTVIAAVLARSGAANVTSAADVPSRDGFNTALATELSDYGAANVADKASPKPRTNTRQTGAPPASGRANVTAVPPRVTVRDAETSVAAPWPPAALLNGEPTPQTRSRAASSSASLVPAAVPPAYDARIYGPNDSDIVPPKVIYPQLITPPRVPQLHEGLVSIEVVVNENGLVDSVKALEDPRTIAEANVVTNAMSAAKSWRFHPALRVGEPVKYRQLVLLATH